MLSAEVAYADLVALCMDMKAGLYRMSFSEYSRLPGSTIDLLRIGMKAIREI